MNLFVVHAHPKLDVGQHVTGVLQSDCVQLLRGYLLLQWLRPFAQLLGCPSSQYLDGQMHRQIFWCLELQKYRFRF